MINALHLIWIIPLTIIFGYTIAALMVIAKESDKHIEKLEVSKQWQEQ